MGKKIDADVLIIGGGILGSLVGYLLADAKLKVLVIKVSDKEVPQADTLRNMARLQTGLLYYGQSITKKEIANEMFYWGKELLNRFKLPYPEKPGIIKIKDHNRLDLFLEGVNSLKLTNHVKKLSQKEAKQQLLKFHSPDSHYFYTPDTIFEQNKLLELIRSESIKKGALFREVAKPLVAVPNQNGSSPIFTYDSEIIKPKKVILCAGAGNAVMLNQLSIEHPLRVFRSPMMIVNAIGLINSPSLLDLETSITIGQRTLNNSSSIKRTIFSSRLRTQINANEPLNRNLTASEVDSIFNKIPESVKSITKNHKRRFVSGFKTEKIDQSKRAIPSPWIKVFKEYPNMIVAIPGKVTFSLKAALDVVKAYQTLVHQNKKARFPLVGVNWNSQIKEYIDPLYDKINDYT